MTRDAEEVTEIENEGGEDEGGENDTGDAEYET